MNGVSEGLDRLVEMIDEAMRAARSVRRSLRDEVIPALPPQRRCFAWHVLRHVERYTFLEPDAVRDIETFLDSLRREIADGTHAGWAADDHHVRGGWEIPHLDDRAIALMRPARELEKLHQAISDVLDAVRAMRLAETLIED